MGTFLLVALIVSCCFHLVFLRMLGRIGRILLYQHRILAAIIVLGTDFMMLIFIGAGNIVGISNLAGGLVLALWIFFRGPFCKDRVSLAWKWFFIPKLIVERKTV